MISFSKLRTGQFLQQQSLAEEHFTLFEKSVTDFIDSLVLVEDNDGHDPYAKLKERASPWHKMRQAAHEYFSASPEEQKNIHHEAKKLYPHKLFTSEAGNPKLAKSGEKIQDHETKGLALAPAHSSGREVCAARSPDCTAACLGTESGRSKMAPVKQSRINRTNFMFDHPKHFYAKVDHEITAAKKSAGKKDKKLAVRMNITSDIPHEHMAPQMFKKHHDVSFYDYTKLSGRPHHKDKPDNYHMTVSSTGVNHAHSNWKQVRKHLDNGGVASMVFKVRPGKKAGPNGHGGRAAGDLPTHVHDHETGKKYRVVDGDEHDHRHLDKAIHGIPHHEGVIAGLRLKTSGGSWSNDHVAKAGHFAVDVDHEHKVANIHAETKARPE